MAGSPADSGDARIRVLIVDQSCLVRSGIAARLTTEPDFSVVGTAVDSATAEFKCGLKQPNVVLLDCAIRGAQSGELARRLRRACPGAVVMVFTRGDTPASAPEGEIAGFLMRHEPAEVLLAAIRAAVARSRSG
jgi:DNA-binding NarL/FixJ family response regulator